MSRADGDERDEDTVNFDELLTQLDELGEAIDSPDARREFHETRHLIERLPGTAFIDDRIGKYTSRDIGEAFVGSIIFGLPLLVEGGVFEIADHLVTVWVAGVPVYLVAHIAFVITLTAGLIYAVDFRDVQIVNPIFGLVPRRLVGVLLISFLTVVGLMALWGRLRIDDPTTTAAFARITVVWAAAAVGASLGDILPGESRGTDLVLSNLDDLIDTRDRSP